jgi:aryl carrier-like protein
LETALLTKLSNSNEIRRETGTAIINSNGIANSLEAVEILQSLTAGVGSRLSSALPSYMIPAVFIPIWNTPLSNSGKVDRKVLQQMASTLSFDELSAFQNQKTPYVLPTTQLQKRVKSWWEKLLEVEVIGIKDNFFNLGGDSVAAMRLVAAARSEGLSLTVDEIFKNPVLSDMATVVRNGSIDTATEVPPFSLIGDTLPNTLLDEVAFKCKITRQQIEDVYPCTPMQECWMCGHADPTEYHGRSVFSLPASLDLSRFRAAWQMVADSHTMLRTRFVQTSTGLLQAVVKDRIHWCKESSVEKYLKNDLLDTMGLGDRLQRFCIIEDDGTDDRYFIWTAHHASYDGWALHLLFEDVEHAYQHGYCITRGPKFNTFIKTLIKFDKMAASSFWKSQLVGAVSKPLFVVPTGHQVSPQTISKLEMALSKSSASEVTLSTMIEMALSVVFAHTLGCSEVVFQLLRTGRNIPLPGIEDLVAATVCSVPLRIRLHQEQMVQDLLYSIQQQQNSTTPFEQLGWENIKNLGDDARTACQHAIPIVINPPFGDEQLGRKMGIDLVWSHILVRLPFQLFCDYTENCIQISIIFDKDIMSQNRVEVLLRKFERVIQQVLLSGGTQKVGDIVLSETSQRGAVTSEPVPLFPNHGPRSCE